MLPTWSYRYIFRERENSVNINSEGQLDTGNVHSTPVSSLETPITEDCSNSSRFITIFSPPDSWTIQRVADTYLLDVTSDQIFDFHGSHK